MSFDPMVKNGIAYDLVELPLTPGEMIECPEGTDVFYDAQLDNRVVILLKKYQSLSSHPDERIDVAKSRTHMRCGYARENDLLRIATTGEYTIPGHGGRCIDIEIRVPIGTEVNSSSELSGEDNPANAAWRNGQTDDPLWVFECGTPTRLRTLNDEKGVP